MELQRETFKLPATGDASLPQMLLAAWRPGCWLIEHGARPPPSHDPAHLRALKLDAAQEPIDLPMAAALSMRTSTALAHNVGPALIEFLARQDCATVPLAGVALHEIIVNAAMHGNLEVAAGPASDWQALSTRQALMTEREADPAFADRTVTILAIWGEDLIAFLIADQGQGYAPETIDVIDGNGKLRAAGRGLMIARASAQVETFDGGRCTCLTFCRFAADGARDMTVHG